MRNATKRATFVYPHVYSSEITNNHHNQPTLESIALHASLTDNPYTIEDLAPSRQFSCHLNYQFAYRFDRILGHSQCVT